jgi:hypothetical protein
MRRRSWYRVAAIVWFAAGIGMFLFDLVSNAHPPGTFVSGFLFITMGFVFLSLATKGKDL